MKMCNKCKETKDDDEFWKHRSNKDGFQGQCKQCQRFSYPSKLCCDLCNKAFHINHRNLRKRKNMRCKECVREQLIQRNKGRAKQYSTSQKGYLYVRDLKEKHGYKLAHRKIMEDAIGRALTKSEKVHHIDGDKTNNDINNLWLTNNVDHATAHNSLEFYAFQLVKKGIIVFDKTLGEYKLAE
jgi:HNH endonuclease